MPMHLSKDTSDAIGERAQWCDSRSLLLSRFPYKHDRMDEADLFHFAQVCENNFLSVKKTRDAWTARLSDSNPKNNEHAEITSYLQDTEFLAKRQSAVKAAKVPQAKWHPPTAKLLRAQLKSRLMVDMAGGVMENAGINLDRYGLPLIPGSAVKGCARRAALSALREWCETGIKPEGEENLLSTICTCFKTPTKLLAAIAHTFGWVETDWNNPKSNPSDFHWACNGDGETLQSARALLHPSKEFAGSIAFLDAHPNSDPGLVLDIVTPHHKDYYEGKLKIATDTEDPVPVFFPAVREQAEDNHFTFPLFPLRRDDIAIHTFAQKALRTGLEVFGVGAKTNAGYGWFDASVQFNQRIAERLAEERKRQEELSLQAAEQNAKAKARAEAKAALAAALEGLTPEKQEDKKLELLSEAQFEAKVRAFCREPNQGGPTEAEKQAIVRALREPRLPYWQTFKAKATKGVLATVDNAIRQLNNTLNLGKMP